MSKLIETIKEICIEEGLDFEKVKDKIENNSSQTFSLEEVIKGDSNYLITSIKKELDKPKLRSGAQIRINTLKTLCELIELNNKRLERIENTLTTISNRL